MVLSNNNDLDMYCAGLIFGNQGSKMLVRFANVLINPVDKDGNVIQNSVSKDERKRRTKGGEVNLLKAAGKFFEGMGKRVMGEMRDKNSDEL